MKIDSRTKIRYDDALVRPSEPVQKRIPDRDAQGNDAPYEELQVRIENVSNAALSDLEVQIQYFSSDGRFLGTDYDLRNDPLPADAAWVATFLIEAPAGATSATIEIEASRHGLMHRISRWSHLVLIPLLAALLMFQYWK